MVGERRQAVTGLTPPQEAEAIIREVFPSVVASPLPGEFRDGYRYVLLAAVAGIGTMIFILKRAL